MYLLIKNAAMQVAVQAVIDLVRPKPFDACLRSLTLERPAQLCILYDVFYHNIDHLVRLSGSLQPLSPFSDVAVCYATQHVWATRRDKAYLKYLAVHITAHGTFNTPITLVEACD